MSYRRVAGALVFAASVTVAGPVALAGPVMAQTYVGVTPPQVGALDTAVLSQTAVLSAGGVQSQVGGASPAAARSSGLAFTGADVMGLLLIAGSSVAVGTAAVRVSRARPTG